MESLLLGTRCCSKSTTARVGLPPVGQMFRARTTASKRSLRSRFKTQNVATEPLLSNKVRQGGPPPELWKAGSVDIAYDLDPTAGADPVESWSKTITVSFCLVLCVVVDGWRGILQKADLQNLGTDNNWHSTEQQSDPARENLICQFYLIVLFSAFISK